MNCPHCNNPKSGVLGTERRDHSIDRVRKCEKCKKPFHTSEVAFADLYRSIKQLFTEGTPICVHGSKFCEYMADKPFCCQVVTKRLDPMLCRAFHCKSDWK